jgi:hypothetical protein
MYRYLLRYKNAKVFIKYFFLYSKKYMYSQLTVHFFIIYHTYVPTFSCETEISLKIQKKSQIIEKNENTEKLIFD